MGCFSEENIQNNQSKWDNQQQIEDPENKYRNFEEKKEKTKEELIQLIFLIDPSKKDRDLQKYSLSELKKIKSNLDYIQRKKYMNRYGKTEKNRLYEYDSKDLEQEETDGYYHK